MAGIVEKRSVERIPQNERNTGFWGMLMLWAGFSISVARLWQGGLITTMGFWKAVAALVISQLFWTYVAIGAVMGAREGLPGTMIVRASFGLKGRILPSIPLIIGTVGWFGLQLGITVSAMNFLVKSLDVTINLPLAVQYAIWGVLMGAVSIYGYRVVMWFQKFISPLLILLIPLMLYKMFANYDVLGSLNAPAKGGMGFFEAITMLVGGQLAMVLTAADSSRYTKSPKTAVGSFMAATWLIGTVMFIIGMMGAVLVGAADPATIVDKLGLGFLGVLIVVFSAWSTNCLNPYWGGIALSTLTAGTKWFKDGIPRATATAIVVVLGTVLTMMGIYSQGGFLAFVSVLAATLGPANGIVISDYFFLRGKGNNRLDAKELVKPGGKYWYKNGWNPIAISVWVIGVIYTFAFKNVYVLITPISTQILSGVLYYYLMKTVGKKMYEESK